MNLHHILKEDKLSPTFYKLPQELFRHEELKELSLEAKILYSFFINRVTLSQVSGWEDDLGRVYIIFPVEEAAELLGKSVSTMSRCYKELETMELIHRHRRGLGKVDLIYVKYWQISATDTGEQQGNSLPTLVGTRAKTTPSVAVEKSYHSPSMVLNYKKTEIQTDEIHQSRPVNFTDPDSSNLLLSKTNSRKTDEKRPTLLRSIPPSSPSTEENSPQTPEIARAYVPPAPKEEKKFAVEENRSLSREKPVARKEELPLPQKREESLGISSAVEAETRDRGWKEGVTFGKKAIFDGVDLQVAHQKGELEDYVCQFLEDEKGMRSLVEHLCQYDQWREDDKDFEPYSKQLLRHSVKIMYMEVLTQMLTATELMAAKGAKISYYNVIEKLLPHIRGYCMGEGLNILPLMDSTVADFVAANQEIRIKNPMAYLKTCIWTTLQEGVVKEEMRFDYHMNRPESAQPTFEDMKECGYVSPYSEL